MLCFSKSTQTVISGTQNANEIRKYIGHTCIRVNYLHLTEKFCQECAVKEC